MKILAICGSPRKGSTYAVLKTMQKENPEIDFKILMLSKMNLEPCRGCYLCVLRGADKCPLKDDRDEIIKEIELADGIIVATPVYVNHISALMKSLIDRLGYESHRPRFFDKYAMVMAVCGGFGADKAAEYMKGIFTTFGFNVVSALELQCSTKSAREKEHNHAKAVQAFNILITSIGKGERIKPIMQQIVMFHMFKYVSEAHPDLYQADYAYYKDKMDYYYPRKINPIQNMIAKRIVKNFDKDINENRL